MLYLDRASQGKNSSFIKISRAGAVAQFLINSLRVSQNVINEKKLLLLQFLIGRKTQN